MVKYEGELEVMSISMIGIDHNMAPVDIRAKFAFTKKNAGAVSYTHLRAHETDSYLVCRLLLEKKKKKQDNIQQ